MYIYMYNVHVITKTRKQASAYMHGCKKAGRYLFKNAFD